MQRQKPHNTAKNDGFSPSLFRQKNSVFFALKNQKSYCIFAVKLL